MFLCLDIINNTVVLNSNLQWVDHLLCAMKCGGVVG